VYPAVILGLGVSGLGCAAELARRRVPFLALERDDRAGGLAKTDEAGGFHFDYGPHVLLGIPAELDQLFGALDGLHFTAFPGLSGIALGANLDSVAPAPFQLHLDRLPLSTRARLLLGALRERRPSKPSNYAEYAAAHCGRGVYDLFLRGYDTKRLRFPLDEIPADWTDRLEKTSLRSILFSRNSSQGNGRREHTFLYPSSGGIEALPRAMARLLPEGSARYKCEVVEIQPEAKVVVLASGEAVRYEHLVTSLALPETIARIRNPPPEVGKAAANLPFTSIYVLNAAVAGPIPPWSILRFPHPELGFYRLSFPSQYSADRAAGGVNTVAGEISHHPTRHPLSREDARAQFHQGLRRLGILRAGEAPVFESIRTIRYAHVVHNQETRASIRVILDYLKRHRIRPCGKYGLWEDMLIPQSILTGMTAAREILADS
jgi:protoporphyrinogen oxidase